MCSKDAVLPHCGGGDRIKSVDRPPGRWGTATLLTCAPQTMLLMDEEGAFNARGPMGTDEGKAAINEEKGSPAPTMPKLDAGMEGSSMVRS